MRTARVLSVVWSFLVTSPAFGQSTPPGNDPSAEPTSTTSNEAERAAPLVEGMPEFLALVDRADLRRHAEFLTADARLGRHTGSPGQIETADYIAEHFQSLGLMPLGDGKGGKRSFFQEYPLERTRLDEKTTKLEIGSQAILSGWAMVPGEKAATAKVAGAIVDCGFGEVSGLPKGFGKKIPVVTLREVGGGPRSAMMAGLQRNKLRAIQREMESRGARMVVYVLDATGGVADEISLRALVPGRPLVKRPAEPGVMWQPLGERPALFCAGSTGDAVRDELARSGTVELSYKVIEETKFRARNVVAMKPGRSKEAVVFSAHMDHVGVRLDGDVYNGADDNASGTSGLLGLATAFSKAGELPRTVIFLSVSGEELGLWGSEYYSEHPTWPLTSIIADINIDMIGRNTATSDAKGVEVTPTHQHSAYSTLVRTSKQLAERMGIRFASADRYYERSDHYNFARKGVPVVFFTNGEHPDYHKASDEFDKLDFAKIETIARLAGWTGHEILGARGRPSTLGSQSDW
jgi:hypothetical protein